MRFLSPWLLFLLQEPRLSRAEGTVALVVAPTRELCLQINDVAVTLLRKYYWLVGGWCLHCLYHLDCSSHSAPVRWCAAAALVMES